MYITSALGLRFLPASPWNIMRTPFRRPLAYRNINFYMSFIFMTSEDAVSELKCSKHPTTHICLSIHPSVYLSKLIYYFFQPNALAEWLTLLLRILEVPASNLDPETGYTDVFRSFPLSFQANSGVVP
jgi:hypothetical protein